MKRNLLVFVESLFIPFFNHIRSLTFILFLYFSLLNIHYLCIYLLKYKPNFLMRNHKNTPFRRISLFLLCILTLCIPSSAQTECDSLQQRLQRCKQLGSNDSIASAYNDLSLFYVYRDADSCHYYCREGLKYADKNKEMPYIDLLMNLANYYFSIGKNDQCMKTYQQIWQEAQRLQSSPARKGEILSNIGVGYRRMDLPDSALVKYKEALQYFEQCKAEEIFDEKTFLLTNIAILYTNMSRVSEGEVYIRQAIAQLPQTEDLETYFYVSNTAGAIFSLLGKYDEAESIMIDAIKRAKEEQMTRFMLQGTPPLLVLYLRTGRIEALNQCIREMEALAQKLPQQSNEVLGFYEQLGLIKAEMGEWEESNRYFKLMLKYHSVNAQTPLKNIYLNLARNYDKLKQPRLATANYEQAVAVMDSIYGTELDQQMSEFSSKFDLQAKQLEIAQLAERNEKQKSRLILWSFSSALLLLALLTLYTYTYFRRKRLLQKSELDQARSFIDGLEQERTRLAGELHDGVCSNILGIGLMIKIGNIDEKRQKDIYDELNLIYQDVRGISHELMPPQLQYAALHEVANDFLMHLNSPEMKVTCHCTGEEKYWKTLPQDISFNVYRMLQELMSNIVRHAGATQTDVNLTATEQNVEVLITNNGKNFDYKKKNGNGAGLATLYERARIIHAKLDIHTEEGKQQFRIAVQRN